jgi:hypothetical protein
MSNKINPTPPKWGRFLLEGAENHTQLKFYTISHKICSKNVRKSKVMRDLQSLSTSTLVDMLSEYTSVYTKLLADKMRSEEFMQAKEIIKDIQREISFRKMKGEQFGNDDPRSGATSVR